MWEEEQYHFWRRNQKSQSFMNDGCRKDADETGTHRKITVKFP